MFITKYIAALSIFFVFYSSSEAQIVFGSYESSTVTVTNERNLDFDNIIVNIPETINLGSTREGVISIEGIRYLDIEIEIDPFAPGFIYLDGDDSCASSTCRVPFTMNVSYANQGQILDVTSGSVAVSSSPAVIPIRRRTSGPPGPPPVPQHTGYTPPTGTAYLYFYGTVSPSLDAISGSYSNSILVSVIYN